MKRIPLVVLAALLPFVFAAAPAGSAPTGAAAAAPASTAAGSTAPGSAAAAASASKPADIVTYRQVVMGAAGKDMKAASMITKGLIARPGDLVAYANALHDESMVLGELFPAGTGADKVKTDAKAEIWSQSDKFKAAVTTFQTETATLVETAKGGDVAAFGAQMGKVGDACGSCHDSFRVKE